MTIKRTNEEARSSLRQSKEDKTSSTVPTTTPEPDDYYVDPASGLLVFTAKYHMKRGYCCKSGCRHCPYDDIKSEDNLPSSIC